MEQSLLCIKGRTRDQIESKIRACLSGDYGLVYEDGESDGHLTLSLVAGSHPDLLNKLTLSLELFKTNASIDDPSGIYFESSPYGPESLAFVFPGQGSQYSRMLSPLNGILPGFKEELSDIFAIWKTMDSRNLQQLIYIDESIEAEKQLKDTVNGQPAIGIVSDAVSTALVNVGIRPSFYAGHSYGELSALKAAGVFSRKTFLMLSRERGRLLGEAGHKAPGSMTAVMASESDILPMLEGIQGIIGIANYNSPLQIVVSGDNESILHFENKCKNQQIKTIRLKTSCAFHSPLMASVTGEWHHVLQDMEHTDLGFQTPPTGTVYSNYTAMPYDADTRSVTENLYRQVENSVFWDRLCQNMYRKGARIFLETGPGNVLTGLIKKILGDEPHLAMTCDVKSQKQFVHLMAKLSAHGIPVERTGFNHISFPEPASHDVGKNTDTPPRITKQPETYHPHGVPMVNPMLPTDLSHGRQASLVASSYFTGNSHVVQSFFSLQETVLEKLMVSLPPDQLTSAIDAMMENNIKIMDDYMQAQNDGMLCFCDTPPMPKEAVQPAPRIDPAKDKVLDSRSMESPTQRQETSETRAQINPVPVNPMGRIDDIIQWVKTEIGNTTGFPEEMVTEEALFSNDLGLDSITLMQIILGLIKAFPEVETAGETIRTARSLASLREILSGNKGNSATQDSKKVSDDSEKVQHIVGLAQELVIDVTGYPDEIVTPDANFSSDLGINSIAMIQIFMKVIKAFPELEKIGEELRYATSLGDLSRIIERSGLYSYSSRETKNSTVDENTKALLTETLTCWEDIETWVRVKCSEMGIHRCDHIAMNTTFTGDLGISIFEKEQMIDELVGKVPDIALAGFELIKADSLQELKRYIQRIVPLTATAAPSLQQTERFLILEQKQEARTESGRLTLPNRLILVGSSSTHYDRFDRFLSQEGCEIVRLSIQKKESGYGWELLDKDEKRFFGFEDMDDLGRALKNGSAQGALPPVLVVDSLEDRPIDSDSFTVWKDRIESGATALFVLAKALVGDRQGRELRGPLFACIQCGTSDPSMRSSAGVLKSLSREWPHVHVKHIRVRHSECMDDLPRIFGELFKPDEKGKEIILDKGGVSTVMCTPRSLGMKDFNSLNLDGRSVLLLTGGGDGITSEIGYKLAETYKCHIVSLGRTAIPDIESPLIHITDDGELKKNIFNNLKTGKKNPSAHDVMHGFKTIKRLQAIRKNEKRISDAGGRFTYIQADVTHREDIERAVADIKNRIGSINGFIHGAGIIDDQMVSGKTVESFRRVLYTKAHSMYHFYHLLKEEPLEFAVMLSSVTSFTGTIGQTDYAAANDILNGVAAHWNEQVSYPVKSMLWSVWKETGLAGDALKQEMERSGLPAIPTDEGVALFLDELKWGPQKDSIVLFSPRLTLNYLEQFSG